MLKIIPHQISCGIYIKVTLIANKGSDGWGEIIPAEKRHQRLMTLLKLIRNTALSWSEFQKICKEDDHKISSACFKEIFEIETLEQLSEIFTSFEDLFSARHAIKIVTKSSVFGLFLRRIILEYKKMSYQETNQLLKQFHQYLNILNDCADSNNCGDSNSKIFDYSMSSASMSESCMQDESLMEEKENMPVTPLSANSGSKKKELFENGDLFKSENKVERFIAEQISYLSSSDSEALNPSEMKCRIDNIKRHYPQVKDAYYLAFLNYLRVYEIYNAISSLQLYFDFKTFDEKNDENGLTDLEKHQLKFKRFRYCALNLGMLHCYYHNYTEACKSLEEAVSVAQETNDQDCLNYAMFWMNYVKEKMKTNNILSNRISIIDLFDTDDMGNIKSFIDIEYLSHLIHAKGECLQGKEIPSQLLSSLSKISYMGSSNVFYTADLTQSAMLFFYGLNNIAFVYPQIVMAKQQSDFQALKNESMSEELLILSLTQLAMYHGTFCLYNEAYEIIKYAMSKVPLYSSLIKKIQFFKLFIEFEQFLNERKIDEMITHKNSIRLLDKHEGLYLDIVTDLICGNFKKAHKKIESLLSAKHVKNIFTENPILKSKLMCMRIEILLLSSQPTFVMNEIISVLKLAEENFMLGMKLNVKLYLVHCFNMLGLYDNAEQHLDDVIVAILSHGSCLQQGIMFLLMGRTLRLKVSKMADSEQKKENLLLAMNYIEVSRVLFQKGNVLSRLLDVYAEYALLYNALGRLKERNEASIQFRVLDKNLKGIPRFLIL